LVSVYSLLAGYEDLNDGERLAVIGEAGLCPLRHDWAA
jgi:hypothetical protein